jgi:hypothetical protein
MKAIIDTNVIIDVLEHGTAKRSNLNIFGEILEQTTEILNFIV